MRRYPPPPPMIIQCFIQRVAKEGLLPRGWHMVPVQQRHGQWAVDFYRGPTHLGTIKVESIERRIGECLDNDVLQLIAKGKEKLWTASKQSA